MFINSEIFPNDSFEIGDTDLEEMFALLMSPWSSGSFEIVGTSVQREFI
jgi:hypothetical protein